MNSQIYWIAQLPPTPSSRETRPLLLNYTPGSGGIFFYHNQQLQLIYTRTETIVNNTWPEGITGTQTQPRSSQISCSRWVAYFGQWPIEAGNVYCGQSIIDAESDTEREGRYFSGFKFDEETGAWAGRWEKRDRQQVFNSTFDYSKEIELVLNLSDGVGSYLEYEYTSTAS